MIEAINNHEWLESERGRGDIKHITEEIADCLVLINQFRLYYGISKETLTNIFRNKVARQLKRMEKGKSE